MPRHTTRSSSEEGLGLVEIMISIVLIGLILAGLASSLMTTLRSIRTAEKTSLATALHQELLESTVALPWERIGIYADDPDFVSTVTEDGGSTYTTVSIPAESPQDPRIDARVQQHVRENIVFDVVRDIYWVDTNGDGATEAKRIRTVIDWTDPAGSGSATFYAMRLPTGLELSDEFEVLLFTSSPNVVALDASDLTVDAMDVIVNTSQASQTPSVTLTDANGGTVTLGPWTANGDATSWTTTLPAGSGPFAAGDQLMQLSVDSADTSPVNRTAALTVTFTGGSSPSPSPAPDTSFSITGFSASPSPAEVTGKKEICSPTYTVRVDGFTSADTVDIQYEYWAASGNGNNTTYTKTQSSRKAATFQFLSGSEAVFQLVHTAVSGEQYLVDQSITLTATATRADSTASKSTTIELPLVYSGHTNQC